MKLGSLKSGRDGRLVVVSHDLAWCADATHIVPNLQTALDDWDRFAPQLQLLATDLAHEAIPMMRFHERAAIAPLPRTFLWAAADAGSAELRQSAAGEMLGARDAVRHEGQEPLSIRPEVLVVTDDVEQGASRRAALDKVVLLGLAGLITQHGAPSTVGPVRAGLSPVFVTPDELGERWRDGKLHGPLNVQAGSQTVGWPDVSEDLVTDFATLVSSLAAIRPIQAGTILSTALSDPAGTFALSRGDTLRIWMEDEHGHATFGTIEQNVAG